MEVVEVGGGVVVEDEVVEGAVEEAEEMGEEVEEAEQAVAAEMEAIRCMEHGKERSNYIIIATVTLILLNAKM